MRILLIDDERNVARMLSVALEADGHEVVAVESSAGALRQVQKTPFDVAFLDLRLGQEDGMEVLTRLRQVDRGLAIVMLAIKEGKFREDLYYRLNVVALHLPPLRERPHDLENLADAHLRFFARQTGKLISGFSSEAKTAMRRYTWPGNLRELRNAVESAVILCSGTHVEAAHLSEIIAKSHPRLRVEVGAAITLTELTDEHIRRVLANTVRLEDAAGILGIDLATLYRRRRKWQTEEIEGKDAS